VCQPRSVHEGSRKAIVAAFIANFGIATIKFVGAAITGSAGLLAEGVHSLADTGNQGLLFLGGSRARQPATAEHPFGFGRERYFWSFVVALVLFSMGGLFAIYEGIDKLIHPHAPESLGIAIAILVVSIALESWSLHTAMRESRPLKADQSWWRFIRTSRNPELPVVLLEDTGALCGLFFALTGVVLANVTDQPRFDALGSLAIGILLVCIAMVLAVENKGLLIGESATPEMQHAIADAMTTTPTVRRVIHLRTEHLGPDDVLVAAKIEFDRSLDVPALAGAIDDVEKRVRAVVPAARLIYLEPDVHRGDGSP
jgi:cation diffusion facilitator family transporter